MAVQIMLPRGIRNNNPLNIRLNPENRWQGRVSPKLNSDGAFEQFHDPVMGARSGGAADRALRPQASRHHPQAGGCVGTAERERHRGVRPARRQGERLRHRRAARSARPRLPEADPDRDDPGRERPAAVYRRADRHGTGSRRGDTAAALAAADADGQRRAGGRRRHHRALRPRRDSGDSRSGARRARWASCRTSTRRNGDSSPSR